MNRSDAGRRPMLPPVAEVAKFTRVGERYYRKQFDRLDDSASMVLSFNRAAAVFGPIWMGARRLWGLFWIFAIIEVIPCVLISRGLWADLGAAEFARASRLQSSAAARLAEAGQAADPEALMASANALLAAAEQARMAAERAAAGAPWLVCGGALLLLLLRLAEGTIANFVLFTRFEKWRSHRAISARMSEWHAAGAALSLAVLYSVTCYRFTAGEAPGWLSAFPADRSWRVGLASSIESLFEWVNAHAEFFFSAITGVIQTLLDGMEVVLVQAPWPIVMSVIVIVSWKLSGLRIAAFTGISVAYLAALGFWEKSMATIALLGTAALISIVVGIPLGVLCARKRGVYAVVRPVLDLMQTMPAFVYLIPVIAFFGIGKPPGILATMIFGMPPVVRLTALGIQAVPHEVREAAMAFGASGRFVLFKVDIPLALPSIMAGINQTILMCLSMVVIASLIGAKGLGEDVLEALTYASEGQGVLAGIAILLCAMVLDRIIQSGYQRRRLTSESAE